MIRVKLLKACLGFKEGREVNVTNNVAHTLIERSLAVLVGDQSLKEVERPEKDKMVTVKKNKVKTK